MTTYAYDNGTHQLIAIWGTGIGSAAHSVARLNAATPETVGLHLAQALTRMSEAVWLTYLRPELIGLAMEEACRALRRPNLPRGGRLRVEADPVVESAHRVGRALREVGSAGVVRAVVADLEEEMAAVGKAERGDLTGRAQQAVMLTRIPPSPAQIAAADRLLCEVPMGSSRLFAEIEPAAASVAAIHWFLAAVAVLERIADTTGDDTLVQAEEVERVDLAVPGTVLRMATAGKLDRTPLGIAQELLEAAVLASRGAILGVGGPVPEEPCFTALDPARPARSLLDGLVSGIQALGGLYATYLDTEFDPSCDEVEWLELAGEHFDAAVREEAAARAPERMAELAPR